jgi:hypothetical protein
VLQEVAGVGPSFAGMSCLECLANRQCDMDSTAGGLFGGATTMQITRK